ncbi:hypothetical protein ACS0TY_021103 [Phlomoides rotata]
MSIQYKFRSSVNFDTVEIGNRASISIGELRSRILRGASQQQQGFDLVFSDAVSGLEFKGDDSQIPSGSSVIVKRVPGGTVPTAVLPNQAVKHVGMERSHDLNPVNGPMDEFDVLGADLCPTPDSNFPDFIQEFDQNNSKGNKKDEVAGLRLGCKNLNSSESDNAIPRGSNQPGNDGNMLQKSDEHLKLTKLPKSNILAVQSTNLPIELKCSLCNNFFKDAVMIPCCQHSFCEKCIRQVLMGKGMCPKCFSRKCGVGDLLPNLSLRQAISHFLESQMLDADLEDMQKDVPDGESGIQAKDFSCVLSVVQRGYELPQSSCATGKGSNQVSTEPVYDQRHWRSMAYWDSGNKDLNSGLQSRKANQLDNARGMHPHHNGIRETEDFAQSADFQGENQPVLPQSRVHDEGGGRNFFGPGGHRKGVRNCYTCGSPDHLMRDCPMSHSNPMFQPGNGVFNGGMPSYAVPYWNGPPAPPFAPYANMYNNPSMMPFNASMVPVSPFAVPPYIPSMHGSLPSPGANMTMRNMGPRPEHFGLQQCGGHKRKHSNENVLREPLSDNKDSSSDSYRHGGREKSHEYKPRRDKEAGVSHSDDSLARRLGSKGQHDKHMHSDERHEKGRNKRLYHGERSNSGKEDAGRSPDWHGEGRHKHHHGESRKSGDAQGSHKNHHRLLEPAERKVGGYEEGDAGHRRKQLREQRRDERWQMVSGSHDDRRDDYHHHKRRAL